MDTPTIRCPDGASSRALGPATITEVLANGLSRRRELGLTVENPLRLRLG